MRPFPGNNGRGAVPSSSSTSFVSMMRDRPTERGHNDSVGLPALGRDSHGSSTTSTTSRTAARTSLSSDAHTTAPRGEEPSPSSSGIPTLKPVTYTITDSTSRKELLAIVQQLQSALNERTDSVNLIQRNFTRLSSMYRRDRDELERLSELLRQQQQQQQQVPDHAQRVEALEHELRAVRDELEQATHSARVMEATHAAETALERETQRGLREALEDAEHSRGRAEEKAEQVVHESQSRVLALESSLTRLQQSSVAVLREVSLFLQQLYVALGEAPSALLSQLDDVADPTTSGFDGVVQATLAAIQEPLLATIRDVRTQCVASTAREETLALDQARAIRQLESQLLDAERVHRTVLSAFQDEQRQQLTDTMLATGHWWEKHLQETRADDAAEREALLVWHKRQCATAASETAEQAARDAHTIRELETQLQALAHSTDDDSALIAALRQQLTEGQSRVQVLLSENKRLAASLNETRIAAEEAIRKERTDLTRQHREALAQLESQLTAQRAQDVRDVQVQTYHTAATEAAQATTAALDAQRADLEASFHLSFEALRLEATRAHVMTSMQHILIESEVDERHHLILEETSSREDLQHTLRGMLTRTEQSYRQQRDSKDRYLAFALVASEQGGRCAVVAEQAVTQAAMSRAYWIDTLRRTQEANASLVARMEACEAAAEKQRAAAEAEQAQRAEHDSNTRELLSTSEAERNKLEMLYTKVCAENGVLVSRVKELQEAMHGLKARTASQQQVAIAALHRLQAAEEASESSYSCPICFQLFTTPATCVPCGHTYCKACLEAHPRNRTSATHSAHAPSQGPVAAELTCPECGFLTVERCIETRALAQLAHTFQYKQQVLREILHSLDEQTCAGVDVTSCATSSVSSPASQGTKSRTGSTRF